MLTRGLKFHFYISCSFLLLLLRNLDLRVPFFFKQIFLCCFHSSLMVLCALWIQCGPAAAAESCLTLCDPIDENPPGSSVPGILQARTLERVAISFSNAQSYKTTNGGAETELCSDHKFYIFAFHHAASFMSH